MTKSKKDNCEKCGKYLHGQGLKIISVEKMIEMLLCRECFDSLTFEEVGEEIVVII